MRGTAADAALHALAAEDRALVQGVLAGERRSLARTLTLLESTRADHRARAETIVEALLPHAGRGIRIGISGAPGVGKSSFIEALGLHAVSNGRRLAVLAVDPSSVRSGGSILGDKTRMDALGRADGAFIRPSPAAGCLGGVTRHTREAILACEAAGHDVVVVETVGIGQSETAVAEMVDVLALLQLPNAGDELQAMKKGVMELADIVIVNKADIDEAAARAAAHQIEAALSLVASPSGWKVPVLLASAVRGAGVAEAWNAVQRCVDERKASGVFGEQRRRQALDWMWSLIDAGLRERFSGHSGVREEIGRFGDAVMRGETTPSTAARRLLDLSASPE